MSRILAIDYGKKRSGIAVTDTLQMIANGLTTVPTHTLFDFIKNYIETEDVEKIIVGLPRQNSGEFSDNMKNITPFVNRVRKNLPQVNIEFYDERFTSVLAHSLGNMVVSEAICSYGFKPDNTILLNAAIPAEAFDASLQDAEANKTTLVPQDWRDYDSRTYASRWNELFSPTEPQSKMKWAGLFENIAKQSPKTRFYNFYSSDDEVFELRDNIEDGFLPPQYRGTLHWELEGWAPWDLLKSLVPETTFSRYAWQKQEFLKGTHAIFGTADGGWAFDLKKVHDDLNNQDRWVLRYTPEEANSMLTNATSRLTLKHTPVFSATPSMLSPNAGLEKQRNERYEILAYRIPALSPAMGSIPQLKDGNNEIIFVPLTVPTVWPRTAPSHYKDRWLHSDIKNMAFFYSFDTVQNLCKAINGNEVKQ